MTTQTLHLSPDTQLMLKTRYMTLCQSKPGTNQSAINTVKAWAAEHLNDAHPLNTCLSKPSTNIDELLGALAPFTQGETVNLVH